MRNRDQAGCRVAGERAADRYTLICDGPVSGPWPGRSLVMTLPRSVGDVLSDHVASVRNRAVDSPGPLTKAVLDAQRKAVQQKLSKVESLTVVC